MSILGNYIKKNRVWISLTILIMIVTTFILELNQIPIDEVEYAMVVYLFIIIMIAGIDFWRYGSKHKQLIDLQSTIQISLMGLPYPKDVLEEDYQNLIHTVNTDKIQNLNHAEYMQKDLIEYYTMWVHQIKTPIAAMRLLLQTEENYENQELQEELFRIEQYVEMVLQYLRLDADTTDLIIKRQPLDHIVKEAVHKYAKLFIRKKIKLSYEPLQCEVLTDEKWLEFVVEQILSNAIKYTISGTISIYMESQKTLVIEDTGIGIRAEDLPRVCEKGYTGFNGHNDKQSTGIGLYLCQRILKKLSHSIRIESKLGQGTKVKIRLQMEELEVE